MRVARAPRRAVRDRRRSRREPTARVAGGGRGARARGGVDARCGARGRGRRGREPRRALGRAGRRSGSDRTSTRFRRAVASTARSGSSRAIEAVERAGARIGGRLPRRGGRLRREPSARAPAAGRCRARSSSCTSSRGPCSRTHGVPLGVVTSIVGYARGELVFEGRAGHAGTTPMAGREDALVAAAEAVLRIRDAARAIDGAVATVGQLDVEPGGTNVIPSRVAHLRRRACARCGERLARLVEAIGFEPAQRTEPVPMDASRPGGAAREIGAPGLPPSSSPRARATTPGSSPLLAFRARCSSSAA